MIVKIKKHDEKMISRRNCILNLNDHFVQQANKFSKKQNDIIFTFKQQLNEQNKKLSFSYGKLKEMIVENLSLENLETLHEYEVSHKSCI